MVSRETTEEDHAHHRQLFLAEQGYAYRIQDGTELVDADALPEEASAAPVDLKPRAVRAKVKA